MATNSPQRLIFLNLRVHTCLFPYKPIFTSLKSSKTISYTTFGYHPHTSGNIVSSSNHVVGILFSYVETDRNTIQGIGLE